MPNIASVLKDEIARLARKEVRSEIESLRKASVQYRSEIAALKRRVSNLEKQQGRLVKKDSRKLVTSEEGEETTRFRFSAKRIAAQRQKLGVSANDMGALLGVSAQTVYNWEAEKSRPRQQQLAAIAALRSMGKREAKKALQALEARSDQKTND
jgi:DNA-binding transcriptional regulator YiaG